jgi:hypothetical protein
MLFTFLLGVSAKTACRTWFFDGKFVGGSLVKAGKLMVPFPALKIFHFFRIYFE